jgi:hypothetical protein
MVASSSDYDFGASRGYQIDRARFYDLITLPNSGRFIDKHFTTAIHHLSACMGFSRPVK